MILFIDYLYLTSRPLCYKYSNIYRRRLVFYHIEKCESGLKGKLVSLAVEDLIPKQRAVQSLSLVRVELLKLNISVTVRGIKSVIIIE